MRVWVLKNGEPWPSNDGHRLMRAGRIVETLLERGHRVTWWTSGVEHLTKTYRGHGAWDLSDRLRLIALPGVSYSGNVSLRRYLNHRQVARKFTAAAPAEPRPDLVVAALPCHHFARAGVRFAQSVGTASVVDFRDLWPEVFQSVLPGRLGRMLLRSEFATRDACMAGATAIVGVSPGYVDRALRAAGRAAGPLDRHFYVGGDRPPPAPAEPPAVLGPVRGKKLLVYAGSAGQSYELELVLAAAKVLSTTRDDFHVLLCGSAPRSLGAGLREHPAATATGWLGAAHLAAVLGASWAGIVPFRAGATQSVPNKVFDYFASGLPVVSSLEGEMWDLVEQLQLGINYRPGSVAALAAALSAMLDAGDARHAWAGNAARFFAEQGDSRRIYADYCDHLETIAGAHRDR